MTSCEPLGAYPGHVPDTTRSRPNYNSNLYLTQEINDLGRPVVQHKPLNKGEHTQMMLSKTFDDPAMRPKVHVAPVTVVLNRPQQPSLHVQDIPGAQPSQLVREQRREPRIQQAPPPAPPQQATPVDEPPCRDPINVGDIEGTAAKPRCSTLSTRTPSTLKTWDVDGSTPGWRASLRTQAGREVDPRYNVHDINDYMPPKIKTLFKGPPQAPQPAPLPQYHHQQQQQQQQPMAYQVQAMTNGGLSSSGVEYTGLPEFQTRPDVIARQRQEDEIAALPRTQVQDEIGYIAVAQQRDVNMINKDIAVAQELQKKARDTRSAHLARVALAAEYKLDREAAVRAINQLEIDQSTGGDMLKRMRKMDRQSCGKLNVAETVHAMREAGLNVDTAQIRTVVKGLRDNVGLFEYRELSRLLMARGMDNPPSPSHSAARSQSARPNPSTVYDEANRCGEAASAALPSPKVTFRPATAAPGGSEGHQGGSGSAANFPVHATYHMHTPQPPSSPAEQQQQQAAPKVDSYPDPYGRRPHTAGSSYHHRPLSPRTDPSQPIQCDSPKAAPKEGSPKYFPFKADPYWFGGRGPQEELAQEAAAYKASSDMSHAVTQYYVSAGEMALLADPGLAPARTTVTEIEPNLPRACNANTLVSALHTGALAPEDLAASLKSNQPRPQTAAAALSEMVKRISSGKAAQGRGGMDSSTRHSTGSLLRHPQGDGGATRASTGAPLRPTVHTASSCRSSESSAARPVSAPQPHATTTRMGTGMMKSTRSSSMVRHVTAQRAAWREDVAMVKALF